MQGKSASTTNNKEPYQHTIIQSNKQFRDEYVKCLKRNVQLKYIQYQGMVKRRNANKNKSQQNADNPKHQKEKKKTEKRKKKDIMELQCPSSIMDTVVNLVYVVIK